MITEAALTTAFIGVSTRVWRTRPTCGRKAVDRGKKRRNVDITNHPDLRAWASAGEAVRSLIQTACIDILLTLPCTKGWVHS
jgi:hypothetical protein